MKKDDLFIYMIPGRCEEKKWSNIKFLLSYEKYLR